MIDIYSWHEALPRPTMHSDSTPPTPVHAVVLMRCAERYSLNDYDAP